MVGSVVPQPGSFSTPPENWWVAGLNLAERLRLAGPPVPSTDPERIERAERRLARWRNAFGADGDLSEDLRLALLAEEHDDLAGRAAAAPRPAWVATVEAVLRDMPAGVDPASVVEDLSWQAGFGVIVAPFVRYAVTRFDVAVRAAGWDRLLDLDRVRDQLAEQLTRQLAVTASRTLVLELNVLRVTERLRGTTPAERFGSFVVHFTEPAAFGALLTEYVVLARLLAQICDQAIEANLELLSRLAADREALVATILRGTDPGLLTELRMNGGVGDSHQGGRSVGLLLFANGARLVYKPRALAVHRHVNDVIRWLDRRLDGYRLVRLEVLDRDAYGWVEFIDHRPVADAGGIRRFYRRQGALLAMLYALDSTDMHYENLIAGGDQPVLVDLESVLHSAPAVRSGVDWVDGDPARAALAGSVAQVGLLPTVVWGADGGAMDLGAVGADAGQLMPFKTVGWANSGTDEMSLTRELTTFPGSQNRPSVDGVVASPGHFVEELVEGFRSAYRVIVADRDGFAGVLARFADDETRVVLRATRTYGTLLMESTHPDVLRDALDRERVFDHLWRLSADDPDRRRAVPLEIAELWDGDIPMFNGRPASRDVWNRSVVRLPDLLDHAGLDRATARVRAMGEPGLAEQEWVIRASMATRPNPGAEAGPPRVASRATPRGADPDRALAAAIRLADRLVASAHRDDRRLNWLGMDLVEEDRWMVSPLRMDLYGGIAGVALFLAQATAFTGDERYADAARLALTPLPRIMANLAELPADGPAMAVGPFNGYSGLAYALAHLAPLTGDPALGDLIEPLITSMADGIGRDDTLDVIGGSAGGLVALLAIHTATGLPSALRLARACADRLVETARPQPVGVAWPGPIPSSRPLLGFSHGAGGIGWALHRFGAANSAADSARYRTVAAAAFGYERSRYDPDIGNWPDYRVLPDQPAAPHMQAWCHGAPGIGLARADLLSRDRADDPLLRADLDLALRSYLADPSGPAGHSLCHGELGNLELLTTAIAAGRTDLTAERDRRLAVVLDQLDTGPRCGTPAGVTTPGLLTGLAGIGYGLLRHAFPDRVPSVLLLAPPIA